MKNKGIFLFFSVLFLCLFLSTAKEYDRFDEISLIAETMFPKGNPSETYDFFYLPFCSKKDMDPSTKEGEKRDVQNLRDDVGGTSKVRLGYMLPFGIMQKKQILCTKYLALHEIKRLIDAVQRKFRIIAYYDDLPLAIPIGMEQGKSVILFRHLDFHFKYNGKHVIEARIIPSKKGFFDLSKIPLDESSPNSRFPIKFTYSAFWTPTLRNYEDRLRTQQQRGFILPDSTADETALLKSLPYEIEIQWMSILVSLLLAIVLTLTIGCLVLRHTWKEIAKYNMSPFELLSQKDDDSIAKKQKGSVKITHTSSEIQDVELKIQGHEEIQAEKQDGDSEKKVEDTQGQENQKIQTSGAPKSPVDEIFSFSETGWKIIAADVFRFPRLASFFPPIIGNGIHLLLLSISFLAMTTISGFFSYQYSMKTAYATMVLLYLSSTGVSGFVSTSIYKKLGGKSILVNEIFTLILFILPAVAIWMVLNTIAIFYQSTAAMPFKTIALVGLLYCFISFPALFLGSRATSKLVSDDLGVPIKPKSSSTPIPPYPWYRRQIFRFFVSGFFPFSAIYIELYYLWLSIWGHTIYAPFTILLICFLLLIVVVSCITIATTYLQIAEQDHKWWWNSFWNGSSVAFFIFLYSIQYYLFESGMNSFLQLSYYFGYNLLLCFSFGLMMGSVGLCSSFLFLKFIFKQIKVD